jgi:transposase
MEEVDEVELHVQRVAALDLGKAALTACVRVPHQHKPGRRMQEVRVYPTTTAELRNMMVWFRQWDVQRVVMESTSDYWKGVYYLLEAEGFERWLVNAREVKNTPGRAKTDLLTELSAGSCGGCVRYRAGLARFAACDRRWGCASGFVRAGGAAAGLSRGDGRSVSTVSAR